jgi:hypothetical protein
MGCMIECTPLAAPAACSRGAGAEGGGWLAPGAASLGAVAAASRERGSASGQTGLGGWQPAGYVGGGGGGGTRGTCRCPSGSDSLNLYVGL